VGGIVTQLRGEKNMQDARRRESGFSLIELLIAMVVTLIIGGAVVALLLAANNAFRREPEVTERQQNIRVAMDMIMRDVANAGSGAPTFVQTFTQGLNGPTDAPENKFGGKTDELEIVSNPGGFDSATVCADPGNGNAGIVRLWDVETDIQEGETIMILMTDGTYSVREVTDKKDDGSSEDACTGHGKHERLNTAGKLCEPPGTATAGCHAYAVLRVAQVRYRIRMEDTVPVLQRVTGANVQVIARGIEDMQVSYLRASAMTGTQAEPEPDSTTGLPTGFTDEPVAVAKDDFTTLTTEVRVSLWARSEARNVQGMAAVGDAEARLRGQLISRGSPRSALLALSSDSSSSRLWN
jgi:type II secretory pathway pseudopilin PulG